MTIKKDSFFVQKTYPRLLVERVIYFEWYLNSSLSNFLNLGKNLESKNIPKNFSFFLFTGRPRTVPGISRTFYFFLCDISWGLFATGNHLLTAISIGYMSL